MTMPGGGTEAAIYLVGDAAAYQAALDEAASATDATMADIQASFDEVASAADTSAADISASYDTASTEAAASIETASAKMDTSFDEAATAASASADEIKASFSDAAATAAETSAAAGDGMVEELGTAGVAGGTAVREGVTDATAGMEDDLASAGILAGTAAKEGVTDGAAGLDKDLGSAGEDAGGALSTGLSKGSKEAETTLSKVGKWGALAAVGVVGVATDMAAKWQEKMTQLVTGAGQAKSGLATVSSGLLDMAGKVGESTTDLATGMYLVESAGFHGAQGLSVLKAAAEGAKTGAATLASVANAVTSALNAYGLKGKDATAVTNELVETVASGKMHMETLASSIANVLPVAASAHVSLAQVGGAMATMTAQGMSARRASMNLANMLRSIIAPSASASDEMRTLGLTANKLATDIGHEGLTGTLDQMTEAILKNSKGGEVMATGFAEMSPKAKELAEGVLSGTETVTALTKAMKGLTPTQAKMVSNFETQATSATGVKQTFDSAMKAMTGGATGLNVALLLSGTHASTFADNVKNVGSAAAHAKTTVQGFATVQKDLGFQIDSAKDSAEAMGIKLGSFLIPKLTDLMHIGEDVIGWFDKNKVAAEALAAVVGGALTVAVGVFAEKKLVGLIKDVHTAASDIGKFASKVGTVASKVVQHFTSMGTQSTTSAATMETATTEMSTTTETAASEMQTSTELMQTNMEDVGVSAQTAATTTDTAMDTMAETTDSAAAATDAAIGSTGIGAILVGLGLGATLLATHWHEVWDGIKRVVRVAWHVIDEVWGWIKKTLEDTSIVGILLSHWDTIKHDAEHVWDDIVSFFEGIPGDIVTALDTLGSDIAKIATEAWHGFLTAAKAVWSDVIGPWFVGIPEKVLGYFAHAGTWLYHVGELIIDGLWGGLKHAWQDVAGWFGDIGHDIENFFTGSSAPSSARGRTVGQTHVKTIHDITTGPLSTASVAHAVASGGTSNPGSISARGNSTSTTTVHAPVTVNVSGAHLGTKAAMDRLGQQVSESVRVAFLRKQRVVGSGRLLQ